MDQEEPRQDVSVFGRLRATHDGPWRQEIGHIEHTKWMFLFPVPLNQADNGFPSPQTVISSDRTDDACDSRR